MKLGLKIVALCSLTALVASLLPGPYGDAIAVSAAPVLQGARIGGDGREIIARACQNCHSNNTVWPWYSHVAPVSWMVRSDVANARKFLNFSAWTDYGKEGQTQLLLAASDQVQQRAMPPSRYIALHSEARLTDEERSKLADALRQEANRIETGSSRER